MRFISGYKMMQHVYDKTNRKDLDKMHEMWFVTVLSKWQSFMTEYYNLHVHKYSIDRGEYLGSKYSMENYNFQNMICDPPTYTKEGYQWDINDDALRMFLSNMIDTDTYGESAVDNEMCEIINKFVYDIDNYTNTELYKTYMESQKEGK